MPAYDYVCPAGHTYQEIRDVEDPQFFTKCSVCGGEFEEVTGE